MNNIPTVTRNLLIINVVVFIATYLMQMIGADLNSILGLHFILAPDFQAYQLLTYMFAHGGWSHIFFNMFALWMFGCIVERTWGARKFLFYYIACGIGAGLFQELAQMVQFYLLAAEQIQGFTLSQTMLVVNANAMFLNAWTTVGASGAIYGILLAFGMLYPEERLFIFPLPVPIKAKWFVLIYAAIELFMAFSTTGDGVAHLAHLGGMVVGFFLIRYCAAVPTSTTTVVADSSSSTLYARLGSNAHIATLLTITVSAVTMATPQTVQPNAPKRMPNTTSASDGSSSAPTPYSTRSDARATTV